MKALTFNQLRRWGIPFFSAVAFFAVIAFVLPYSTSLWEIKRSIASLVFAMCKWGEGSIDSSYCLMVPPIVIYLVWQRWTDLRAAVVQGSDFGLALIAVGLFTYWFGMRAGNQYFGFLAIQILLAATVIWLWGWAVFRIVLFPWAFLGFGWPMPFLDAMIAFPLRMDMSTMAAHLLPAVGIPTLQNGTALLSPADPVHNLATGARFQIDIADPCSGIRSLFALLMFSALFGYLFLPRLWQQWVIFLSAFPLAILGNLVRVVLLVLGSICFGSAFAIGTLMTRKWESDEAGDTEHATA
jgi:exosortase